MNNDPSVPTVDAYAQQFTTHHPETGELSSGGLLQPEQVTQLAEVFSAKVVALSRASEITREEASFLDTVVRIGSRCVVAIGMNPVAGSEHASKLITAASHIYRESSRPWPLDAEAETSKDMLKVIDGMTGGMAGVQAYPYLRAQVEDYAGHIMPYFAEMVANNGAVALDDYMTGNLQNLVAHYEMTENSRAN